MTTTVFLHIDRTGGMALREWLAAWYPREQIRPVPHHSKASWQPTSYPLFLNADLIEHNRGFVHKAEHKLVMGHWDAGILDKIPGEKKVITVLRHPAERAASLWRFICQERAMYGAWSVEARRLGMEAFLLRHGDLWVHAMSRQLSGARWTDKGLDYRLALKNVQEFDTVWVTEYLPSLTLPINGEGITLPRVNGTIGDELEPEFRAMVADLSPLDTELYHIAKTRCEIELQQNHLSK